jgi:molecular chaperone DnaJ
VTMRPPCYYRVLGVAREASAPDIKIAYRRLALQFHPDRNPGSATAEARLKEVNRAYQALGDQLQRALYDEFGEEGLRSGFDPERAREAARLALDPRRRPADTIINIVVDRGLATTGGRVVVALSRTSNCTTCSATGAVDRVCTRCWGFCSTFQHGACVSCTRGWVWNGYAWTVCQNCLGTQHAWSWVPCDVCWGSGMTSRTCWLCTRGRVEVQARITVVVPEGTAHGQCLRVRGKSPRPGGDLYLRVLIKQAA